MLYEILNNELGMHFDEILATFSFEHQIQCYVFCSNGTNARGCQRQRNRPWWLHGQDKPVGVRR